MKLRQSRIIQAFLLKRAARRYASRLGNRLRRDYGGGEYYTEAQIRAAVRTLNLPLEYVDIGLAAYLPADVFTQAASANSDYHLLRALFRKYVAVQQPAFEPAPGNQYAIPGSDASH